MNQWLFTFRNLSLSSSALFHWLNIKIVISILSHLEKCQRRCRECIIYIPRLSLLLWKSYGIGEREIQSLIFYVRPRKMERHFVFLAVSEDKYSRSMRVSGSLRCYISHRRIRFRRPTVATRQECRPSSSPVTRIAPAHFSPHSSYLRLSNTFINLMEVACFNKIRNND